MTTTTGGKSSGKVKRISIPRVQSSTDTELQSQQSGGTPLQPSSLHYTTFRTDPDESPIPPALRSRLMDLFQQIEKEFEIVCAENVGRESYSFLIISIISFYIPASF